MDGTKVGQHLCAGFQGTTLTTQARDLIVKYGVSTFILSRKNAVSAKQLTHLIAELQYIAYTEAKYKYPIMFAVDEEGGMLNSLFDPESLIQVPGAMGLAATGDTELVYKLLLALALELKAIGFLIIFGPVLDVVMKLSHQLVSVRSFGATIEEVVKYGRACAMGLRDGGLFTFGKHFPGIGNASVDSIMELPMLTDSLDQLRHFNSVPFAKLMKEGLLDGISAAGCGVPSISPDEIHACLSPIVMNLFLRQEMGFEGVVVSECLEMDVLYHSLGIGQGAVLAIQAGCDLVMVCHDFGFQSEAIESLGNALYNGSITHDIARSLMRIEKLQRKLPSWEELFPLGKKVIKETFKDANPEKWREHQMLSEMAYQKSITLVRDLDNTLPLTKSVPENSNILILSPLLAPMYPSSRHTNQKLFPGEEVFQNFGNYLAEHPKNKNLFKILHTTYTANGLTALHENLIEKSNVVIILTSEASRNLYQIGIVKYVSMLCGAKPNSSEAYIPKSLIVVATLSPYDFLYNKTVGNAYLCCYDYTEISLRQLASVLMGDIGAEGTIPGEKKLISKNKKRKTISARRWLVEEFELKRDWPGLIKLMKQNLGIKNEGTYKRLLSLLVANPSQKHFVVRNSSLKVLYGIVLTWVNDEVKFTNGSPLVSLESKLYGKLLFQLIDKSKQMQNVGKSLYERGIRYLVKERNCLEVSIGGFFPMFPSESPMFTEEDAWIRFSEKRHIMLLENLSNWHVPTKIFKELMIVGVRFDINSQSTKLIDLINSSEDEQVKLVYHEALKSFNNNRDSVYETKIILALEPTNQNVIGSIILFTSRSQLSRYVPFMMEESSDGPVGAIFCPMIDPSYSNLINIFIYGLVCSALTYFKSSTKEKPIEKCILVGIEDKSLEGVELMDFKEHKVYWEASRPAGGLASEL